MKKKMQNSKLVSEPHSWPTSSSLLCAFFKPQAASFNTILVLQIYLNSLPNELRSKQPSLVERTGLSRLEDLGMNPDFVLLELHDLEQIFNSLSLNFLMCKRTRSTTENYFVDQVRVSVF